MNLITLIRIVMLIITDQSAVRKTKDQAEMFKKRALKSAVDMLTDVDYKIKRGILEANDAMWLSIFKIMLEN